MVTDLKHIALAARLYADENDGALPHDLNVLFASDLLAPLQRNTFPTNALLYHRLGDDIDRIPEKAIMLSYISKRGAFYANYAGEASVAAHRILPWGQLIEDRAP